MVDLPIQRGCNCIFICSFISHCVAKFSLMPPAFAYVLICWQWCFLIRINNTVEIIQPSNSMLMNCNLGLSLLLQLQVNLLLHGLLVWLIVFKSVQKRQNQS